MRTFKFISDLLFRMIAKVQIKIERRYEKILADEKFRKIKRTGKVKVEGNGVILEPENLTIGTDVSIGRNFFIRASGGVSVGNYTHISRNVVIHTVNHNISGNLLPYDNLKVEAPVNIGNYVWIGMNVCILPGVSIGDGAIIGMGTVVSKDVSEGDIVVGSKQRVVGSRNKKHTDELVEISAYLKI